MTTSNPLNNLKIDYWYKALVVVSATILIVSLTVKLEGIENQIIQLLSLGTLLLCIGEWINHPLQTALMHPNIYARGGGKITSYKRKSCLLGSLFDILGFIILFIGVFRLFQ